jgi:hypothetical protein
LVAQFSEKEDEMNTFNFLLATAGHPNSQTLIAAATIVSVLGFCAVMTHFARRYEYRIEASCVRCGWTLPGTAPRELTVMHAACPRCHGNAWV